MASPFELDRRDMMRMMGLGVMGSTCARWLPALAAEVAFDPRRTRHCILLWMSGGPSQTDTFDMKPGHDNGGEFKEAPTKAPGLRFTEHLPKLVAIATDDICHKTNPKPCKAADFEKIFSQAL